MGNPLPQTQLRNARKAVGMVASLVCTLVCTLVSACQRVPANDLAVGTLEMVEVDVGPLILSRAVRIFVHEGDHVRVGDTLAIFATPTLASAEVQALARVESAREASREIENGARPAEIARAESELRAADADAERAAAEFARLTPLAVRGDVSKMVLGAAQAATRAAAGRRDALREALRIVREGPRAERKAIAAAEIRGAAAAAAGVRATASDLVLIAPVDGIVTSRNAEPGEVFGAGQSALTVGQTSRPWARIYVSQFVLPRLHVGDTLSATLDRDSTTYRGRIVAIASKAEFTPRVALTDQERADLLFSVKLEFTDTTQRLKAGLPITVRLPRTPQ